MIILWPTFFFYGLNLIILWPHCCYIMSTLLSYYVHNIFILWLQYNHIMTMMFLYDQTVVFSNCHHIVMRLSLYIARFSINNDQQSLNDKTFILMSYYDHTDILLWFWCSDLNLQLIITLTFTWLYFDFTTTLFWPYCDFTMTLCWSYYNLSVTILLTYCAYVVTMLWPLFDLIVTLLYPNSLIIVS